MLKRLCDQLVPGGEMFIKTADCQAGILHQVSNADSIDSALAETFGSNAYDTLMRCNLFSLRMSHCLSAGYFRNIIVILNGIKVIG